MKIAVVDASVCAALLKADELQHEACRCWFEQAIRDEVEILAPALLLAELAAALGRGLSTPELAHRAVAILLEGSFVELLPVTRALAVRAAKIAADQRIRGCDSIYVALAESLGAPLITLDHQQLERGRSVVETRTP